MGDCRFVSYMSIGADQSHLSYFVMPGINTSCWYESAHYFCHW